MNTIQKSYFDKKINITYYLQKTWDNHLIGWKPAIDVLSELHSDHGIKFIGYLDEIAPFQIINHDFIGFFHHTPKSPSYIQNTAWCKNLKGLEFYFSNNIWKKNESRCKGIFVLCNQTKNYIETKTNIPVACVYHPTTKQKSFFSMEKFKKNKNKILVHPGNWLRNFDAYNKLESPYKKTITGQWFFKNPNNDIMKLGFLTGEEYKNLLKKNIVFQNYHDVAASNTVLECIAMNTPIVLNRLPANEEYLGCEYPLFYNNLDEAENLLKKESVIEEGHEYLKNMDKTKFDPIYFLKCFCNTNVYQNLRIPRFI